MVEVEVEMMERFGNSGFSSSLPPQYRVERMKTIGLRRHLQMLEPTLAFQYLSHIPRFLKFYYMTKETHRTAMCPDSLLCLRISFVGLYYDKSVFLCSHGKFMLGGVARERLQ